jgi:hypothetical protein
MFDSFLQIQLLEYNKFAKLSEEINSRNSDNNSDVTNNIDGVKEQLLRTKDVIGILLRTKDVIGILFDNVNDIDNDSNIVI